MNSPTLAERLAADPYRTAMRALPNASLPYFRPFESPIEPITVVDGRPRIMLGANNYLGLANHPAVVAGARDALDRFGGATVGSRLYSGTSRLHLELEYELARWHDTEDAIVFATGYQANMGAVCGLLGFGDSAILDGAAHASIQDGAKQSAAGVRTFRHNDLDSLREQLDRTAARSGISLVAVEALYSMAGDLAPLSAIARICGDYGAALMVDEAHSVGVLGPRRTGLVEWCGLAADVDIRMGTFSKALASTGGFFVGSRDLIDTLRVNCRSFIFTSAAVPAALGSALAAVRIARGDEGAELAARVLANAARLHALLRAQGLDVGGESTLESGASICGPIVSVPVGDELGAVALWQRVFERGVYAGLSMFPAVAPGQALLRLSIMATHTAEQLETAARVVVEETTALRETESATT